MYIKLIVKEISKTCTEEIIMLQPSIMHQYDDALLVPEEFLKIKAQPPC
jgi:hypothetical protein